jgi:hypothetical protein
MFALIVFWIPCTLGVNVVSNSVTTGAGTVSYSIYYSAGTLTHAPTEMTEEADNNAIIVAIKGCSISADNYINGRLDAHAAGGDWAYVYANAQGPGASFANYNLYGYVTPNLAWAGQYADSIKGSDITLGAHAQNDITVSDYAVAESKLTTHNAISPDYTVNNWWQDSMAGGSYNPVAYPQGKWAMSDIYDGIATVDSSNVKDYVSLVTSRTYFAPGSPYPISTRGNDWVYPINSIRVNGQSMGYADSKVSYSNVDGLTTNKGGIFDYWYVNLNKGINTGGTIFW